MSSKPSASILVVDDNIDHLEMIHRHLTYCGFNVIQATDPHRGLELSKSIKPDIIIADIRMPGLDGLELVRKFKEVQPKVKVILVTGYYTDYEPSITKALETGLADGVLQKRYRANELEKSLRDLLKASSENMLTVDSAKAKILIAEDEADFLDFLSDFFSDRDFAVQAAKNAARALELYRTFSPDVVLTDIMMPPGEDGFWLVEQLRKEKPDVWVIAMTGQDSKPVWDKLKEVGIPEIFVKPIGTDKLEELQAMVLERIKTRRKTST
jgi:CheY-like chemotaxis protein